MASENETVEDIVRELRDDASKVADEQHDEDCWTNLEAMQIYDSLASRIESAWRREKAELQLAIDAEKARHTDDYKDERIRAQDEEIMTLKGEMAKLRECLKEAIDYNCATCKSKGKACEVEGFCAEHRWRKALEGANDQDAEIATLKSEMMPRRNCDRFHGENAVSDALCEFYKECSDNSRSALVKWMLAKVAEGEEK